MSSVGDDIINELDTIPISYLKKEVVVREHHQLDTTLLAGYMDNLGKEIVQQMLDLYSQQSVVYLQDIDQALTDKSQQQWQECCHKMKGATGSAGLIDVHAKLVDIEKLTDSWSEKQIHFTELSQLNTAAIDAFNQWLESNQG
ncbi:Hpt domain-containing protein [Thalassotalea sp. G2M2-11]|uniref:Hpt domain-containing protein n=1 Tax=Thalassotalea sp. G2M2-11 TaxID=2787627 RepID=UPI0019CFB23B|nr:Hpt domain-containing protein [Thalassotalea sp. G2M2-11]